ncbi:hypothetical protein GCM10007276_28030 [Agaricicola taiwanensis]|uniref:Heme-binding protein n=1 Tax=Agaricicola taiwanensis TaxID=591372 RepID=A0A8J2YK21_9RHOB|nr:heme-binding protein [Agaricicola taiwanensis]GGE49291.1 hypothetical protein GCM10007276_28030 [Agaricicola taiwanensis]
MKLETAQGIVTAILADARDRGFNPLAVAVMDARGAMRALATEDGTSTKRAEIAMGKAHAAVAMGFGTRDLAKRAPQFLAAVTHAVGGLFVPVPGGVLIRSQDGSLLGSVGVSGESSDNDEMAAVAGITAQALVADPG